MNLSEYQKQLAGVSFGKRLPNALYAYIGEVWSFENELDNLVRQAISAYRIEEIYNVVKFRLDELKISFLAYPDFLTDPHPALQYAITIDLVTGRSRHAEYIDNPNPPVLHRKEALLPHGHPMFEAFEKLTRSEEAAGLYADTMTIGFKLNWERLLAEKGLIIQGHELLTDSGIPLNVRIEKQPRRFERHKTAITRNDLSKPIKTLIEYGLLSSGTTLFDYGSGHGSDIEGLRALGFLADGWDPVHRPAANLCSADVVNLGYVLNVIEDSAERLETLCRAFSLAKRLLVVSALISETVDMTRSSRFRDGVITKRNTFQKFFEQRELQQYVEDALEVTAVPVALGIFYVFKDPGELQDFISERTRRFIDWTQISTRLGFRERRVPRIDTYEAHKEILDAFWSALLDLGRLPTEDEFPRLSELRQSFGTPQKAERLFIGRGGAEVLERARQARRDDLLVYLALSNLRKVTPFLQLSLSLQRDIRDFFGDYKRALISGRDLLFSAGNVAMIQQACENSTLGWQDDQALYIHHNLLKKLPPVLQVYAGCAALLGGDIGEVDLIKLHKASGKVTYLIYQDFETQPMPELRKRVKINLRTFSVQVFDHSNSGQVLFFKDEFLMPEDPLAEQVLSISTVLRNMGVTPRDSFGPPRPDILLTLESLEFSKPRSI